MSLLEIDGLTHAFGDNEIFKNASMTINAKEHIGLVGQNGAGKSTLIKICTEQIIPDSGYIKWQPNIKIGYLDQYAQIDKDIVLKDYLRLAFKDLIELEAKMNDYYNRYAVGELDCLKKAANCQEILDANDYYLIDTMIETVASGLGLKALGMTRKISEMSGGQRAKIIMAKMLLEKPDIMFLDEPTNYLDSEHVSWLTEFLISYSNAFVVVSHDFAFLNRISNRIGDIDNKKIEKYYGSYAEFQKKKTMIKQDYIRHFEAQQKSIKQTEEFIRKNIAGRKAKMARGRQKQLERLDKLERYSNKEIKPIFKFKEKCKNNSECLEVKRLDVGYKYPILKDINFDIRGGQKVAITGFNGVGKTTMLKTLLDIIPSLGGSYLWDDNVKIGYFEQDIQWEDARMTPIDIVAEKYPMINSKEIRTNLAFCGIHNKQAIQEIKSLSGGEQTKVKLCLLMMGNYDFLILDEPTNHLDIQAKEALKKALVEFQGTILLVSHEKEFYEDLVERVIRIAN